MAGLPSGCTFKKSEQEQKVSADNANNGIYFFITVFINKLV
ncbi:hypothetical protein M121_4630 [Bacteroides fragilis str. 3783N2-1]|nr:hypothetical protein M121_4630 [Bacteroides fragilis str. 3783N2-1]EXY53761.1 hypothetical protein M122_4265 [Bacteroides fragilis str. 3976T7]